MGFDRPFHVLARAQGRACSRCSRFIRGPAPNGAPRLCPECAPKPGIHRVYLQFYLRDGWLCHFLDDDMRVLMPRKLRFQDPEKIMTLARIGGASMKLEDKQAIEFGIKNGRGSICLNLTDEQYAKLK